VSGVGFAGGVTGVVSEEGGSDAGGGAVEAGGVVGVVASCCF
jgi:hypothetical protein